MKLVNESNPKNILAHAKSGLTAQDGGYNYSTLARPSSLTIPQSESLFSVTYLHY